MSLYFMFARAERPLGGRLEGDEEWPWGEACFNILGRDFKGSMCIERKLALCW